jgi:glycosyltransferase involved in cell wall biosynthesis
VTRIGMNPARNRVSDYQPARVTVGILVYIPHLEGYFQHRLGVVQLSLASLLHNTAEPYDLLVFDNGSCDEVHEYLEGLRQAGAIRFLLTSKENIGKLGAMRLMAGAAPGDLVAYADDDTFFDAGWLRQHLQVYEHFPRVGMVSGSPEKTLFSHGISTTLDWAAKTPGVKLTRGSRIPEQWEREWAVALGKDEAAFLDRVRSLEDIQVELSGFTVYATACHNQFLSPKDVLVAALAGEWSGRLMGGMNEFDEAIDRGGFLRLTTLKRTTRLIGNVVTDRMADEAAVLGIRIRGGIWRKDSAGRVGFGQRLVRTRPIRRVLQGLYNRLFWILSGQRGEWVDEREDGDPDGEN